jgi:predicted Zn-ribbon and HTH transcriptional regulator
MTAAARNTRKNAANARNSIPRNTSLTHSSITRSPSPSLTALDSSTLNRAKHDSAIRSARATAAHAARRESEQAIFGRPATATERGYLRHLKSLIKNTLAPACKVEGIEIRDVLNRAIEQLKRH